MIFIDFPYLGDEYPRIPAIFMWTEGKKGVWSIAKKTATNEPQPLSIPIGSGISWLRASGTGQAEGALRFFKGARIWLEHDHVTLEFKWWIMMRMRLLASSTACFFFFYLEFASILSLFSFSAALKRAVDGVLVSVSWWQAGMFDRWSSMATRGPAWWLAILCHVEPSRQESIVQPELSSTLASP